MRRTLALLAVVTATFTGACSSGDDDPTDAIGVRCITDDEMDTYSKDVFHTDAPGYKGPLGNPPTYRVNPPSGGDHLSQSTGPGVFAGLNVLPDGVVVHALEHGYVVLWHRGDTPVADITTIRDVQAKYPRDALVVERKDLPGPVAATAWKQRLLCDGADAEQLSDFVEKARNKGPEKVPH
jgi:hypothetical protein